MSAEPRGVVDGGNPTGAETYLIRNGWWFVSAKWRFLRASWLTKPVGARHVELAVGRITVRLTWGRRYGSDGSTVASPSGTGGERPTAITGTWSDMERHAVYLYENPDVAQASEWEMAEAILVLLSEAVDAR